MNDKERQELLDQALDRIMSGPIGQRKEGRWDQYNTLITNSKSNSQNKAIRAKIVANTDWEVVRKKQVANTDYTKHREMFREANIQRRKKIKAFKVVKEKGVIVSKTFISIHDSILQCSKDLNILQGGISNILNPNHAAKSYKGYTFEYA